MRWSGGSICSGISGRFVFMSCAVVFDENVSGSRSTWSTPVLELTITPTPSSRNTGRARLQHRVDRLRVPRHVRVHQLRQPGPVALVTLGHDVESGPNIWFKATPAEILRLKRWLGRLHQGLEPLQLEGHAERARVDRRLGDDGVRLGEVALPPCATNISAKPRRVRTS